MATFRRLPAGCEQFLGKIGALELFLSSSETTCVGHIKVSYGTMENVLK
ncbi:hypothetical protein [Thermaerobacillus caldiproteolyticus]|uniref:Uncharacterized protein n=1 Tax=Thermaerobacillus caldiproteolyticus TaxID=247480 RepID=A0A7V9Z964_9BACL|nr:hypothetical protein [Anoxybacillus caldiproteolyticus]MBA2876349.1 hypothetical protein [Anoxybacillus caldiproteolyticus]QPA31173.1 hypothetical protein ISX45_17040 [Anoxybacillus caldiproteolyticus]